MNAMEHDLSRPWSLRDLATTAKLSPSRLNRVFHDALGVSPIEWLIHRRVRKMTQLLRETHQPVRDIARAVGWTNQAHAAQQFRKFTGRSPTEYRSEVRQAAGVGCLWCGHPMEDSHAP